MDEDALGPDDGIDDGRVQGCDQDNRDHEPAGGQAW